MSLREQLQKWEDLKGSSDWSGLNKQEQDVVRQQFYQRNIKPLGQDAQQQFLLVDKPYLDPTRRPAPGVEAERGLGAAYGAGFESAQQQGLLGTAIRAAGIGELTPEREALTPGEVVTYGIGRTVGQLSDPVSLAMSTLFGGAAGPVAKGLMRAGLGEKLSSGAAALGLGALEGGITGAGQALLEPTLEGEEKLRVAKQQGLFGTVLGTGLSIPIVASGLRQGIAGVTPVAPARSLLSEPTPAVAPGRVVAGAQGATEIPRLNLSGLDDKQLDSLVKRAQEDPRFRYADRIELEREQARRSIPVEQPEPFNVENFPYGTKPTPEGAAEQARLMAQRGFQKPGFEQPTEMPLMSDAAKAREKAVQTRSEAKDLEMFNIISDAERAVAERKKAEAAAEAAKVLQKTREAEAVVRKAEKAKAKEAAALTRQQRYYESLTEAVRRVESQISALENKMTFGFEVPSQKKRDALDRLRNDAATLRARRDAVGKTIADLKRGRTPGEQAAPAPEVPVAPEVETPSAVVEPPPSPSAGEAVTPSTTEPQPPVTAAETPVVTPETPPMAAETPVVTPETSPMAAAETPVVTPETPVSAPETPAPVATAIEDPVPPVEPLRQPTLPDDKVVAKRLADTDPDWLKETVVERYTGMTSWLSPAGRPGQRRLGKEVVGVGTASKKASEFASNVLTKLDSLVRDKKMTRDQADEYIRYLVRSDMTNLAQWSGAPKMGVEGFSHLRPDELFDEVMRYYKLDSDTYRRVFRLDNDLLYTKYRRELGLPDEFSPEYLAAYKQYDGNIPEEWYQQHYGDTTQMRLGGQPEQVAPVKAGNVPLQRGRVEVITYPQQAATRQAMGLTPDIDVTSIPKASAPEPKPPRRVITKTADGLILIEESGKVMKLRRTLPQRVQQEPMPGTPAAPEVPTLKQVAPAEERNQTLVNQENQAVTELDEMARRGQRVASMPEEMQADYISSSGEGRVISGTSDVTSFLEALKGDGRVQALMRENEADINRARVYDTITWDDTKQQLAELGVDSDFLKKSAYSPDRIAKNVLGIWKYQQDLIVAMRQLARKIQLGEGSPLDEVNLARLAERFQDANAQAMGVRAALGRGMNIMRAANTMEGEAGSKAVQAALNQAKTMGSRGKELAELIVGSGNNNAAVASAAMNIGNKYWNIFEEYWRNSILSGFGTQTANIIANTVATATTIPETAIAALIGGFKKESDRVYLGEVNQMLKGIVEGGIWGLQRAKEVFKTETDVLLGESKLEFAGGAIEGELGKTVRIPSRALAAGDAFFKEVNKAAAARALLYRDARRQGMDAVAAAKYADDVRMGVKEMPKELADEAWKRSEYQTFTNDLDKRNFLNSLGNAFLRLRREWPALSLIFPFIRTPVNVANYALDRSAFRLVPALWSAETRRALATPGAARDEAIGRIVFGTGVTAAILGLAQKGLVTGGGPVDKDEKAAWEAAGNRPYSMKIGDTTVQYNRYAPWGIIMGVAADMLDAYKIAGEDRELADKSWKLTGKIIESIAKNVGDQTMISGLVNVTKAFSESDRYLDNMAYSVVGGVVPGAAASVARAIDPSIKELQDMGDALKQRVPGLRQTVAPKLLPLGEERRSFMGEEVSTRVSSGIIPGFGGQIQKDTVYEELSNLKYSPSKPIKTIEFGGVEYELPSEEINKITKLSGPLIRSSITKLLEDKGYQALPDEQKRDVIERVFRRIRGSARKQVLADLITSGKVNELKQKVR